MTLHPTVNKLDALSSMVVQPGSLFKLISDPEFMCHITLATCGYRVEEKEVSSLPPTLLGVQKEGVTVSTPESQFKALELLLWMVGVHLSNTNRCVCVSLCVRVCVCVCVCVCESSPLVGPKYIFLYVSPSWQTSPYALCIP